jgi:putative addiction module component (TIGR02574 family)
VEEIWDSIMAAPEQVPLTEAQRTELDARLAKYEADPTAGASWEAVKVRVWGQP